jgi:hypothetical protein
LWNWSGWLAVAEIILEFKIFLRRDRIRSGHRERRVGEDRDDREGKQRQPGREGDCYAPHDARRTSKALTVKVASIIGACEIDSRRTAVQLKRSDEDTACLPARIEVLYR